MEAEARQLRVGQAMCGRPVDGRPAPRLVPEHDVLADGEVRAEVDLLIDG
jgi:hypothetical protein